MIKVYRSELENDKFYLNKDNSLLTDVELFDNNKPKMYKCSIEKMIFKFKGENNYFVTFNIEQRARLFVKFLNEFNVSI